MNNVLADIQRRMDNNQTVTEDEVKRFNLLTEGVKNDSGKLRTDLLPVDAIESLSAVLTFGAKKYADRNWERGMSWSRCYGACLRHLFSFWRGQDRDDESGLPHLAHAMCCVMFLLSYQLRQSGTDDRP